MGLSTYADQRLSYNILYIILVGGCSSASSLEMAEFHVSGMTVPSGADLVLVKSYL